MTAIEARETGPTEVGVNAAARSCITGRDVFIIKGQGTFLGYSGRYNRGIYNNADHSLMRVSANEKMFGFLDAGEGWVFSQQKMIDEGYFTEADYDEYAQLLNSLPELLGVEIPAKKFCLGAGKGEYDTAVSFTTDKFEMLISKLEEEQRNFVRDILQSSPEEILDKGFEYTTREDIIDSIREDGFDEWAETLLPIRSILAHIYERYTDFLSPYREALSDVIYETVQRIRKENAPSMEQNPVHQSSRYSIEPEPQEEEEEEER